MKALLNLLADLGSQLKRPGGRLRRLLCVLRYWALYERGRLRGQGRGESRLAALAALARSGEVSATVVMGLGGGLRAELDVFSAAFLAKEILDDETYGRPGFVPQEGWVVVDVGAHQGLFTLEAARRVGPRGRVLSFEPFAFNRDILARNVAANSLAWVEVVGLAASDARGSRELYVSPYNTGWQSLVFKDGDERVATRIETDTLDHALDERGAGRVDLLKVDVEGAWRLVFAGAPRLLARRPRIIMEVEGDDAEVEQARERLMGLGYGVERGGSVLFAAPDTA